MKRFLSSLRNDRRGVATIELAIMAPVLATMIVGVVDLSNAFGRKLALEQATQRAVEKVMQTTLEATAEDVIKGEAAAQAGIDTSAVTVTYQLECNEVKQALYSSECAATERESRYLLVTANDKYTPMFPVKFLGINADGTYHLSSTSGLRTQ
ncbi:TadE/TadG family type IV pilus assembly protein [Sphingomonas sp. LY29]|uniref:TadE/TadG family type IV pilus assembly protein n=1 Tax=unclassified Sphingomonas TaxID=196159 RepID=UPI002ADEB4C4|nr:MULTISPECIES: TadE/TadG family type IV pilus assembly protein [unclassified Sphingomonas]MEA1071555.1 TadE/TadG family type IV pilus assembly protein [Sphingomonas sp. LY160]WRP25768.1 TadE/TadG family type IV pilus assembly protein [Sphingomonas sp. LY29]